MCRFVASSALGMVFYFLVTPSFAETMDVKTAKKIVDSHLQLYPLDDITQSVEGRHVRVADLNGDGVDEIVYVEVEKCVQSSHDCPNTLTIFTKRRPGEDMPKTYFYSRDTYPDEYKILSDARYATDAIAYVPGEVKQIQISGNRVDVTFDVVWDSPVCQRMISMKGFVIPNPTCPPPGQYRWTYVWTPGHLEEAAPH